MDPETLKLIAQIPLLSLLALIALGAIILAVYTHFATMASPPEVLTSPPWSGPF